MKNPIVTAPDTGYPQNLNVLTLNCWGLKFLAKYRRERLAEIGAQLTLVTPKPDIVGLQECWTQEDYHCIRNQVQHFLPYSKFYFSGIFGGGLVIFSKWPIVESNMYRYPLNGRPTAFFRGDWFVGKGVACAKVKIGPGIKDYAEVFCTHLHAPYEREPNDSYICHRTAQAWDIAKLMRGAAERGHLVVGLGDFNMIPMSLAHRLVEGRAPVRDVWRVVYPDSSLGAAIDPAEQARHKPIPNAGFNLTTNGTTCDSVDNTWRWAKEQQKRLDAGEYISVDPNTADPNAKRLDYIFFGDGASYNNFGRTWQVDTVSVGFTQRHPTLFCSLSDHFSVAASFSCRTTFENGGSKMDRPGVFSGIAPQPSPEIYNDILAMIHKYHARERRQRKLRLGHFGASLVVTIFCLTGVWWSPHNGVAFLLILLSSLSLTAGVIDGLIGGLFVGSEIRALKEFEWEICTAKDFALNNAACD